MFNNFVFSLNVGYRKVFMNSNLKNVNDKDLSGVRFGAILKFGKF